MAGSVKTMAASISSAAIFILGLAAASGPALAQMVISDDEARRAIIDLRVRLEAIDGRLSSLERNLQTTAQGQLQILNENERLRAELAVLRGQIEEINQAISRGRGQQKDLYSDLDRRVKQLEPISYAIDGVTLRISETEKSLFEELRELLRAGEFKKAAAAADLFAQTHPHSALSANALLIKGSALYADKNYKAAIAAREEFLDRYTQHPARPQAMLNLAASQAESGNTAAARTVLEGLIKNYPNTAVASEAKDRLKTLKPASSTKAAPSKSAPSK